MLARPPSRTAWQRCDLPNHGLRPIGDCPDANRTSASVRRSSALVASTKPHRTADLCAGARRLRLLSVTGFPVSLRPRLAEFAAVGRTPPGACPSLAPGPRRSILVPHGHGHFNYERDRGGSELVDLGSAGPQDCQPRVGALRAPAGLRTRRTGGHVRPARRVPRAGRRQVLRQRADQQVKQEMAGAEVSRGGPDAPAGDELQGGGR